MVVATSVLGVVVTGAVAVLLALFVSRLSAPTTAVATSGPVPGAFTVMVGAGALVPAACEAMVGNVSTPVRGS